MLCNYTKKDIPCNGQRRKMTKSLCEEIKSHGRFLIKVLIFTVLPAVTGDLKRRNGFISCLHLSMRMCI